MMAKIKGQQTGITDVWRIFCGKSSKWRIFWQP